MMHAKEHDTDTQIMCHVTDSQIMCHDLVLRGSGKCDIKPDKYHEEKEKQKRKKGEKKTQCHLWKRHAQWETVDVRGVALLDGSLKEKVRGEGYR